MEKVESLPWPFLVSAKRKELLDQVFSDTMKRMKLVEAKKFFLFTYLFPAPRA